MTNHTDSSIYLACGLVPAFHVELALYLWGGTVADVEDSQLGERVYAVLVPVVVVVTHIFVIFTLGRIAHQIGEQGVVSFGILQVPNRNVGVDGHTIAREEHLARPSFHSSVTEVFHLTNLGHSEDMQPPTIEVAVVG